MRLGWTRLLLVTAVVGVSGCSVLRGIVAESVGVTLETKVVAYKHGSHELIATDGTYCLVSRGRFEDVAIGDPVQCTWGPESTGRTHDA